MGKQAEDVTAQLQGITKCLGTIYDFASDQMAKFFKFFPYRVASMMSVVDISRAHKTPKWLQKKIDDLCKLEIYHIENIVVFKTSKTIGGKRAAFYFLQLDKIALFKAFAGFDSGKVGIIKGLREALSYNFKVFGNDSSDDSDVPGMNPFSMGDDDMLAGALGGGAPAPPQPGVPLTGRPASRGSKGVVVNRKKR